MLDDLLKDVAARAARYHDDVTHRGVFPSSAALRDLQSFSVELQRFASELREAGYVVARKHCDAHQRFVVGDD